MIMEIFKGSYSNKILQEVKGQFYIYQRHLEKIQLLSEYCNSIN